MSETFPVNESLSNQIYLAELLISAVSGLISAVWKVVPCKRERLHGEIGDSMELEDEAAPWLFWVLAPGDQQWTAATTIYLEEWMILVDDQGCYIVAPGRWRLGMGFPGHLLSLPTLFNQSRKSLLILFENKVLSASWRTRASTGVGSTLLNTL